MIPVIYRVISIVAYIILAPLLGGLLDGLDRKISARMQGRVGPPLLQPFYDFGKLMKKQFLAASRLQILMIVSYLFFICLTGVLFFGGFDILLCVFSLTTAVMFLILAATVTHSPFSSQGTHREMMQMMSYEPMVLLTAVGFYLATGSFSISDIIRQNVSAIALMPGFFFGFLFILTIKFRKSPFDLSTSHHAHQEVVKGVTTEMVGVEYAITILTEWYENIFLLGMVALFFINSNPWSILVAIVAVFIVFFIEILVDNTSARVKWEMMLKLSWGVTLICGGLNLFILEIIKR